MRRVLIFLCSTVLAACATTRVAPPSVKWQARASDLQRSRDWQLDGRAAVAVGTQGWQAALDWQQAGSRAVVHLSGPFGIGAMVLKQEPDGLSVNDAPPSDAVTAQLQERLGFQLPLDYLHFWLLGVPDPTTSFELTRNDQDRARQLTQGGWSIVYDRYLAVEGDLLPGRLILSREAVRVRVVIDHWNWPR
jgi:outer membrane lipoprotein LolB